MIFPFMVLSIHTLSIRLNWIGFEWIRMDSNGMKLNCYEMR